MELSVITGVLLCHYYVITIGYLEIHDLYTAGKSGNEEEFLNKASSPTSYSADFMI